MEVLEKLYNCADNHLDNATQDWESFAAEFCEIFKADMVLYHVAFEADFKTPKSYNIVITSKPKMAQEYTDQKLYLNQPIEEASLAPLEPRLRTELMSDEELKKSGTLKDFIARHGYFYQLIAPAILPDGTFLGLVVWRDETEEDFNALDKQRMALFMRHLLAKVQLRKLINVKPDDDVTIYGSEYNLTKTETEILAALLDGHSLKSIASVTERSYGTVRWHVQNILSKCQVNNQKALLRNFYSLIKA